MSQHHPWMLMPKGMVNRKERLETRRCCPAFARVLTGSSPLSTAGAAVWKCLLLKGAAWPHPTYFSHLLLSLTHKASGPSEMHCLPQSSLFSFSYSFPHPTGPSSYLICSGKGWNILSPALPFGLYFPENLVLALVISLPDWHDSGTAG